MRSAVNTKVLSASFVTFDIIQHARVLCTVKTMSHSPATVRVNFIPRVFSLLIIIDWGPNNNINNNNNNFPVPPF